MGYTAPLASRPSSCWEPCLGLGLWTLGFGLWSLGFGFALGFFVFCSLGFALWALGTGHWALGSGLWALGFGLWVLALGFRLWGGVTFCSERRQAQPNRSSSTLTRAVTTRNLPMTRQLSQPRRG